MIDIEELPLVERLEWIRRHLREGADVKWAVDQLLAALIAEPRLGLGR